MSPQTITEPVNAQPARDLNYYTGSYTQDYFGTVRSKKMPKTNLHPGHGTVPFTLEPYDGDNFREASAVWVLRSLGAGTTIPACVWFAHYEMPGGGTGRLSGFSPKSFFYEHLNPEVRGKSGAIGCGGPVTVQRIIGMVMGKKYLYQGFQFLRKDSLFSFVNRARHREARASNDSAVLMRSTISSRTGTEVT